MADEDTRSVRERGEEVLGEFAQALLENPLFNQALTTAFEARERAVEAQRSAMGALDISSASEVERLGRRLRSLSDRLEAVEDSLDSLTRDAGSGRDRAGRASTGGGKPTASDSSTGGASPGGNESKDGDSSTGGD